ncbi:protein DA1-related 1-like isoform X2 [Rhodamnia argentea]|uniref:Protein DA1-related 1-like isoform X1 n=1 Tax=Rhodamnia argentea TaxID=178133 RepID=A0A8B8MQY3_9MYRT|nr:protein DA1-related 1-like isoform X2 [Rhodamnia argentea]XP_048136378.1 protein DA1-related 1-like isoform X2 [Rhodamnia argentea]XP_048136384.1 protein DA1-related 1-like isoform X2 [Rhodamnia argentea]
MERFSRTLEGRGHGGRYQQNIDADGFSESQQISADELTDYEREDIDYATALSLSEEDQKGGNFIGTSPNYDEYQSKYTQASNALLEIEKLRAKAQLVEDELLAIAVQNSLYVEDRSKNGNGNSLQLHPASSSGSRICAGCKSQIGLGDFLTCMGADWHQKCFCCHACGLAIAELEFSVSGEHPYHETCFRDHHYLRCEVCKNYLPINANGIEYAAHPFWMQIFCQAHERDGTPRCSSCERMEPRDTRYLSLDDGRKLCLECLESAIMDTDECQPLYLEIQGFYKSMNMKVDQQIPLLLVERQALNEAMEGGTNGHHHSSETRGLCLSEGRSVPTVMRRARIGAGNQFIDMITEPYKLVRSCDVTAILILYGLPRLLTGSILAHEMMHAWLRLEGYPNLSPEVEEGICQVLAHMWLNSEIESSSANDISSSSSPSSSSSSTSKKGKWSDLEIELGKFFKHQIRTDVSKAYGEGFRLGNEAMERHGLRKTLDHIRLTGTYPL